MDTELEVQPLSRRHRKGTFRLLMLLFVVSLPFLYLYATGYRLDLSSDGNIVSTGGMYIGAERSGAEIYIDDELVRETRAFRRAFYAQSLEPGTHKVHVQKDDHHTWVKELPVSPHLVTEAQAFNLPIVPEIRVVTEWQTSTGSAIAATTTLLHNQALFTNEIVATTTKATTSFEKNGEYTSLLKLFATTTATSTETITEKVADQLDALLQATSTEEVATTTKEFRGVMLFEKQKGLYAGWVGMTDDMPYYYCAEEFEPYSASSTREVVTVPLNELPNQTANTAELVHPVQVVPENLECDPIIQIHQQNQTVHAFDFYPGSTDLVVIALDDGIYVIEIDGRAWQNIQPLVLGTNLDMRVENGQIYVYDTKHIYHVILES